MGIGADFPIRKLSDFSQFFTFQKDEQNHGRGRSIFWKKNFSGFCPHVIAFFKARKGAHWGHTSPPHPHGDQGGWSG